MTTSHNSNWQIIIFTKEERKRNNQIKIKQHKRQLQQQQQNQRKQKTRKLPFHSDYCSCNTNMCLIRKVFQCHIHVQLKSSTRKSIQVKSRTEREKKSKIYQFEHVVIGKQHQYYYCCNKHNTTGISIRIHKTKCFGYPCGSIFKADLLFFMCVTFYVVFI